tara:strand:+ start:129 stop:791 length:663 start_codon:yes stop_codon:yes gene_type:complete
MVKTTTATASKAKNASTKPATVTTPAPICFTNGYTIAQHVAIQNPSGTHCKQAVTNWLNANAGSKPACNVVVCPNIANNAYVASHIANIGGKHHNGIATRSILALVHGIPMVNGIMLGQQPTPQLTAAKVSGGAQPSATFANNPCPSKAATTSKQFNLAQLLNYWAFVSGTCKVKNNTYKMGSSSYRLLASALSGGLKSNAVGFGNGVIKLQLPAKAPVK